MISHSRSFAAFPPTGAAWRPAKGSWDLPVLEADNATWEHSAVQEPQVIYQPKTKSLRMWYRGAGWGFPSGVGVADSFDGGITWQKYKNNPVYVGADQLSEDCAGQPWVYQETSSKYWLFTTNNHPPRTCVAFSTDGLAWKNASRSSESVVPLPPNGTLFGNRAAWKEADGRWKMLQECGTTSGVWQIFLYEGTDPFTWSVGNGGQPLSQLQRHPGSMYGGCHIATIDGVFTPLDPADGNYHIWYHAGANGNLPTDVYHASSADLLNWDVSPSTPVLTHQGGGSFAFDQVADPSPLTVDAAALLFYDGDNNRPGVSSHAAIGLGVAAVHSREYV